MDKLEVGTQSREDVQRLIGSPSAVATFNPNVWYYITEKQEWWGPSKPWIVAQAVIQMISGLAAPFIVWFAVRLLADMVILQHRMLERGGRSSSGLPAMPSRAC